MPDGGPDPSMMAPGRHAWSPPGGHHKLQASPPVRYRGSQKSMLFASPPIRWKEIVLKKRASMFQDMLKV